MGTNFFQQLTQIHGYQFLGYDKAQIKPVITMLNTSMHTFFNQKILQFSQSILCRISFTSINHRSLKTSYGDNESQLLDRIYLLKQQLIINLLMLPKLQIPYKNKLDDSHIKDKYVIDQNKLASQIERLSGAISHLCKFLQNRSEQKSPKVQNDDKENEKVKPADTHIQSESGKNSNIAKLVPTQVQDKDDATLKKQWKKQNHHISIPHNIYTVNQNEDIQERFRDVAFQIKIIKPQQNREKQIQKFLANLLSKVLTRGFYYLQKGLFNDKKYRNFCCSNILIKILEFAKINSVTQEQFNFISTHLAQKVLPYQKCTYPKAQSQQINLKLSQAIYEINNLDANENDLILQSKIKFWKKKTGDYTVEIMKFVNFLLEKTRFKEKVQQEGQQQQKWQTLSESYLKEMSAFFQKIYNEKWVNKAKKNDKQWNYSLQEELNSQFQTKFEEQNQKKEEYEKKVKSYTKYEIGVKISENVRKFSSKSILEQNFQLGNPGLMRVLTKWSQDLEEYIFDTNEMIINRQQNFIMMDGSQSYLSQDERVKLASRLQNQRPIIKKYLAEMSKSMVKNQFKAITSRRVEQFTQFATEKEAYIGCFATMVHKSNANYLINYLNKLIDCILTAQGEWANQFSYEELSCAYLIPSLISFSIGDLMRCKISSKQKEITALFNYLNYINRTNPEKLEIIRIKNKLRQGTKDVLINLRYKKSIIVEMQLAIQEEKSTFIQCSQKANHFIYELQRARFGSISELCNLWCVNDERFKYFSNMFEQLNAKPIKKQLNLCQHKKQDEKFPVWCNFCEGFISNISAVTPHMKCQECKTQICFNCLCKYGSTIVGDKQKVDKQTLLTGKQKNGKLKIVKAIDIEKKNRTEKQFSILRIKNQFVLFEKIKQEEYEIVLKSQNHKKIIKYFSNFLVLKIQEGTAQSTLQYLKNVYFKKYFEQARIKMNRIILYEGKASINLIQSQRYPYLKKLCLINAGLTSMGQMPNIFPFCQIAILNKNTISDFKNLEKWKTLSQLHLEQNRISVFPEQLIQLTNLRKLSFYENSIGSVPENIGNLSNLMELNLSSNKLTLLPESFKNLTKLQELSLMWNNISTLSPHFFDEMKDLRKFLFKENQISEFPYGLTRLHNIQQIFLACNQISVINSDQTFNCRKLKLIIIRQNLLTSVPKFIGGLEYLEQCNLEQNNITHFEPGLWQCKSLKTLNLSKNKLQFLPNLLNNFQSLQTLTVSENNIEKFETGEWNLPKLKNLLLFENNIKSIPKMIGQFKSLQILNLSKNPVTQIQPGEWKCENLREMNLLKTELCQIPKFIGIFKNLKQFLIGNSKDVELELPQSILDCSQQLTLKISANFKIKSDSQELYEKLINRKQIKRINL